VLSYFLVLGWPRPPAIVDALNAEFAPESRSWNTEAPRCLEFTHDHVQARAFTAEGSSPMTGTCPECHAAQHQAGDVFASITLVERGQGRGALSQARCHRGGAASACSTELTSEPLRVRTHGSRGALAQRSSASAASVRFRSIATRAARSGWIARHPSRSSQGSPTSTNERSPRTRSTEPPLAR
jgi:hypothetical protein